VRVIWMGDHLIPWANKFTRGHDNVRPVENFTDSWADGLAFCALLHTWFPDRIPMQNRFGKTKEEKVANFKLAFDVASENGVETLLDPEDTAECQDLKSMILYLSYIYDAAKGWPVKFTASYEWNKNFEAVEKQRKFLEWKAKQDANKPPEPIQREHQLEMSLQNGILVEVPTVQKSLRKQSALSLTLGAGNMLSLGKVLLVVLSKRY